MTQTIDMDTLKQMISLLTPAPVAPVKELAPISSHDDALMANNIQYIQRDITEIKGVLKEITTTHVTISDFNENIKKNDMIHSDHETRIRNLETSTTKILVWGGVILGLLTIAQFALKFTGN